MSILRVGSTSKYAEGWELAFGKKSSAKSSGSGSRKTSTASAKKGTDKKKGAKRKPAAGRKSR